MVSVGLVVFGIICGMLITWALDLVLRPFDKLPQTPPNPLIKEPSRCVCMDVPCGRCWNDGTEDHKDDLSPDDLKAGKIVLLIVAGLLLTSCEGADLATGIDRTARVLTWVGLVGFFLWVFGMAASVMVWWHVSRRSSNTCDFPSCDCMPDDEIMLDCKKGGLK